jgi:hypothetical protein
MMYRLAIASEIASNARKFSLSLKLVSIGKFYQVYSIRLTGKAEY